MDKTAAAFQRQVAQFAKSKQLFADVRVLVVGVSGGADSVALLDWLVTTAPKPMTLIVAHLNHGLRGRESDADETFVVKLARDRGLQLITRREDVRAIAERDGISVEEAGRVARYRFFAEIRVAHGGDAVAVAHHADDQAETVLMRLIRGAGGCGLAAMTARSADGTIIRPFLAVYRQQICSYLTARGLGWREDSSNTDCAFLRNRIRRELLPLMTSYNPAITARLCTTAAVLAEENQFLDSLANTAYEELAQFANGRVVLPLPRLRSMHGALRRRVLRMALAAVNGSCRHLEYSHLQEIEAICSSASPSALVNVPQNCIVERQYDKLIIRGAEEQAILPEIIIAGAGSYALGDGRIVTVSPAEPGGALARSANLVLVSAAAVPFPWRLRYFCPGDRFTPSGMAGQRKVKEYFIDQKVPRRQRQQVPLLESKGRIFWICGYRVAAAVGEAGEAGPWLAAELHDAPPGLPEGPLHGK